MAVNKVVINRDGVETVLVDITDATVTPQTLAQGATAYAKSGEKITGTMQAGIDTSDATATAADILSGKTAYVKGTKVTGNIGTKTASNLTASGATVTVPAGYYASQASKSVSTATQATPSISVNSSGLITASATQTAGYVSAGTKSGTKQLSTQAAKTITPSTSSQTAVVSGVYTTGAVTVGAIPNTYVQPTTTKAATTYTPTTSNQTIAAGTYCSGVQTIKGDSNLVAGNIKKGVSIFGVAGNFEGSGGSGGGGSVDTCTIDVVVNNAGALVSAVVMRFIDGKFVCQTFDSHRVGYGEDNQIITDVVCGSLVALRDPDWICYQVTHSENMAAIMDAPGRWEMNEVAFCMLQAPLEAGATGTVTFE